MIQAEVRDARLRILADDLVQLTSTVEREVADETALLARRAEVEDRLRQASGAVATLEAESAQSAPAVSAAQDAWYAASSLLERVRATGELAAERVRLLAGEAEDDTRKDSGRDPEALRAEAEQFRSEHSELTARVTELARSLVEAEEQRAGAERAHQDEQQRLAGLARAAADRREGLATLAGRVAAARSRAEAGEAEVGRLQAAAASALSRAGESEQQFAALEGTVVDVEEGEEGLDAEFEAAEAARQAAEAEMLQARDRLRALESERASLTARREALELSLRRQDGAAALLVDGVASGVVGPLPSLVSVPQEYAVGLAAALGWAGEALVVADLDSAAAALGHPASRGRRTGRAAARPDRAGREHRHLGATALGRGLGPGRGRGQRAGPSGAGCTAAPGRAAGRHGRRRCPAGGRRPGPRRRGRRHRAGRCLWSGVGARRQCLGAQPARGQDRTGGDAGEPGRGHPEHRGDRVRAHPPPGRPG